MSEHYDFHYQPTGSGAISGQQVLQQTEDAINELGDYVNDNVGGAMDVAQQALETAQNAEQDAQTALDTANSFSSAIQSAQQDASTALSTAQTAQTTASNANNTAIQAQQDASNAVTTANNASGQVSTLSGTVTTLGQRVTTAEGNIGQNTSDITALTTRVGTAEGNITTLQNDVSIAQGNASSAMATAGTVKQQAFVFRYSSTALTPSSTNSNTLLDNTDNLKVGDKVIDSSGVLFSITAIDSVNSTFTVGSALVDLALDANVVHTSGNETISGIKTFTDSIQLKSKVAEYGVTGGNIQFYLMDKNGVGLSRINQGVFNSGVSYITLQLYGKDSNNQTVTNSITYQYASTFNYSYLLPTDNSVGLGSTGNRWGKIYGIQYYYGSNNIEFSTKFVTTDTAQTITGVKAFSATPYIYNSDVNGTSPNLYLRNQLSEKGNTANPNSQQIVFVDKNAKRLSQIQTNKGTSGETSLNFRIETIDNADNDINSQINYYITKSGSKNFTANGNNEVNLGISGNKWKDVQTYKVNNLEPSSLSLPSGNANDVIDISSYISALDGTSNSYTAPANGWISIAVVGTAIAIVSSSWSDSRLRASSGNVRMLYPVLKNETVGISVTGTTLDYARFIPCQGNV